jgi:hypothetical protein
MCGLQSPQHRTFDMDRHEIEVPGRFLDRLSAYFDLSAASFDRR